MATYLLVESRDVTNRDGVMVIADGAEVLQFNAEVEKEEAVQRIQHVPVMIPFFNKEGEKQQVVLFVAPGLESVASSLAQQIEEGHEAEMLVAEIIEKWGADDPRVAIAELSEWLEKGGSRGRRRTVDEDEDYYDGYDDEDEDYDEDEDEEEEEEEDDEDERLAERIKERLRAVKETRKRFEKEMDVDAIAQKLEQLQKELDSLKSAPVRGTVRKVTRCRGDCDLVLRLRILASFLSQKGDPM